MEDAMDGEEFPYPGLPYLLLNGPFPGIPLSVEDEEIIDARIHQQISSQYGFDDTMDLIVMHARTSCLGVKPAMKNLAVFLKYS